MTRRSRFRTEPRCSQCGNEEDLSTWPTGEAICAHCLQCPHTGPDIERANGVCLTCLRALHTLWTFEGPRIRDAIEYVKSANREYVVRSYELLYWTFDEQEAAVNAVAGKEPLLRHHAPITCLPPHLRR